MLFTKPNIARCFNAIFLNSPGKCLWRICLAYICGIFQLREPRLSPGGNLQIIKPKKD